MRKMNVVLNDQEARRGAEEMCIGMGNAGFPSLS